MWKIYKYTAPNGKCYIGQTKRTLRQRGGTRGQGYIKSEKFANAIEKYTWDAFTCEILEECTTLEQANEREKYWIEYYDSVKHGYNICGGGNQHNNLSNGTVYQFTPSGELVRTWVSVAEASRELGINDTLILRAIRSNTRCHDWLFSYNEVAFEYTSRERSVVQYTLDGKYVGEYTKIADAAAITGVNNSSISAVCRGKMNKSGGYVWRYKGDAFNKYALRTNAKRVQQFTLDGDFLREYDSITAAAEAVGASDVAIGKCCKGETKSSKGYRWKYL